jgi:hypothetical protein
VLGVCYGEFGKAEWRTADPSTSLRSGRDDKGWGGAFSRERLVDDRNSRPRSTSLRAGSPLRFASVGMTILFEGVGVCYGEFGGAEGRIASCGLHLMLKITCRRADEALESRCAVDVADVALCGLADLVHL